MIYTTTNNKFTLRKVNDKEILDETRIATYPLGSNIPFIKCFDDKDIPNPIGELKKYIKCLLKMINFDDMSGENIKKGNANWPQIPDHPNRILIMRDSGSGKANTLLNL